MTPMSLEHLAIRTLKQAARFEPIRYALGIAGPPAAGKSTLADALRDAINSIEGEGTAEVAPMDGFHRSNLQLAEAGWTAEKGQPHTFDVAAFIESLRAVRVPVGEGNIRWPQYDRALHEPVPDRITLDRCRVAIVEGNYLLLDGPGWSGVRDLLDETWYLAIKPGIAERRLYERHLRSGRSKAEARRKIADSDYPNLRLIETTRKSADLILVEQDGEYFIEDPS
ncbi:nucleoside triphosphate hydrolase [Nocardia sp. NPDC056000]|uniref:nucleoside triphosphate hydrolase n=1 Tax=Nocardia sp. NPDC056000 TaxID=3345674 RepID=UPI0035E1544A